MKPLLKRVRGDISKPKAAQKMVRAMIATDRKKMIGHIFANANTKLKELRITIQKAHPRCPTLFSFLDKDKEVVDARAERKTKTGDVLMSHPYVGAVIYIQAHSRASTWTAASNAYLDFRDEDLSSSARLNVTRALKTRGASTASFSTMSATLKPLKSKTSNRRQNGIAESTIQQDSSNMEDGTGTGKARSKKGNVASKDGLKTVLYEGAFRGEVPDSLGPILVSIQQAYRPGIIISVRSAEMQRVSDAIYLSDLTLSLLLRENPELLVPDARLKLAEFLVISEGFLVFKEVAGARDTYKLAVQSHLHTQRRVINGEHWELSIYVEEGSFLVQATNTDSVDDQVLELFIPISDAETAYGSKVTSDINLAKFGFALCKAVSIVGETNLALNFSSSQSHEAGSMSLLFSAARPLTFFDGNVHSFIVSIHERVLEPGKSYRGNMKRMTASIVCTDNRRRYELCITQRELVDLARQCGDPTLLDSNGRSVELYNRIVRRIFFLKNLKLKSVEFRGDAVLHKVKCFRTFYPHTLQITAQLTLEWEVVILAKDQDGCLYEPLRLSLSFVAASLHRPNALMKTKSRDRDFKQIIDLLSVDADRPKFLRVLSMRQNRDRAAAISIQRAAKGRLGRKKALRTKKQHEHHTSAAIRIQSVQRRRKSLVEVQSRRQAIVEESEAERAQAVRELQRIARGRQARKWVKEEGTKQKKLREQQNRAAAQLQRLQRGWQGRKQVSEARKYQHRYEPNNSNKPRLQLVVRDTPQGIAILAKGKKGNITDASFFGQDVLRFLVGENKDLLARSKRQELCSLILSAKSGVVSYVNTVDYNPNTYAIVLQRKFYSGRHMIDDKDCFVKAEIVENGLCFHVEYQVGMEASRFVAYLSTADIYRFLFPKTGYPDSLAELSHSAVGKLVEDGFHFIKYFKNGPPVLRVPRTIQRDMDRFGKLVFMDVIPVTLVGKGAVPLLVNVYNVSGSDSILDFEPDSSRYFVAAEDPTNGFVFEVDVDHEEISMMAEVCGDSSLLEPQHETNLVKRLCKRLFLFEDGEEGDEEIVLEFRWEAALSKFEQTFIYGEYQVRVSVFVTLEWEIVILGVAADRTNVGMIQLTLKQAQKFLGGKRSFLLPQRMRLNSKKLCGYLELSAEGELVLVDSLMKLRTNNATKIQTIFRGKQGKVRVNTIRAKKSKEQNAAVQLQKSFRGYTGRKIKKKKQSEGMTIKLRNLQRGVGNHIPGIDQSQNFRDEAKKQIVAKTQAIEQQQQQEAEAILRMQGLYRGHRARKCIEERKENT